VRGFTLTETLVSIAITTLVMTPLFVLNTAIMRSVVRSSHAIERTLLGKNFLIEAAFAVGQNAVEKKILEKKVNNPKTFLRYERKKIDKKSSLFTFADLYMHQVTMRWQDLFGAPRVDMLVSFVFQPTQKKKDKQ
jgi:hypothetical protein